MSSLENLESKRNTTMTKMKEPSMSMQSNPNPWLPDDLLLSCLARVSRLYYPALFLVSKRFRSLLVSPEIYKARSLLGHTETCLYVFFELNSYSQWYTLCLKPNQTLTDDTREYVLAKVPIPRSPHVRFGGLVAVGSNIYGIEESPMYANKEECSSDVWILDCRTHTWCEAPSLPVKLVSLSASFLDGKIYVAGCRYKEDGDYSSWKNGFEVFDTKTQIWDPETIPCSETLFNFLNSRSNCIDGKFHVMKPGTQGVAYNSQERRWDLIAPEMEHYTFCYSECVIDNVMYYIDCYRHLRWYDTEVSTWRCLTGLKRLPMIPSDACMRLADYGGKLAVLWETYHYDLRQGGGYKKIWCAEIALERRQKGREIWGKV
ncbi:unnamed protein product [Microthlaspi erraticum]|uniref:F-box domain-containing protein n=1 Tax=Microthlaspi erraticum TaxID=1685480 RepID=A0A6D2III9_9BRAS|nr:unnamed protein product [Microthlaspi erraticum]